MTASSAAGRPCAGCPSSSPAASFADGGEHIRRVLREEGVQAGFFFTGDFYRTPAFEGIDPRPRRRRPLSGRPLRQAPALLPLGRPGKDAGRPRRSSGPTSRPISARWSGSASGARTARLFIPPYEWYNREIAAWSRELGLTLFNFTPGTSSNADYTTPSHARAICRRDHLRPHPRLRARRTPMASTASSSSSTSARTLTAPTNSIVTQGTHRRPQRKRLRLVRHR